MRPLRGALLASLFALGALATQASAQGFRAVYSPDSIDVIAVGNNGETYRSFDGGASWNQRVVGSASEQFRDVAGSGTTLVIVGNSGSIWRSTDNGGAWTETIVSAADLRAVAMPTAQTWFAAGTGGGFYRTTNAGALWVPFSSGTSNHLNALKFTDASNGWMAGDNGTLLRTTNGGVNWTPVALGTTNHLTSVDQQGSTVWVVGLEGTAYKSTNGGASFAPVNLKFDAQADVNVVWMVDPDTLYLCGGGGFIRKSTNGGQTWTFQSHRMHAPITDFYGVGGFVWATNALNRTIMYSSDRGAFWRLPTGATFTRSWVNKSLVGGQIRGNPLALNPINKHTVYAVIGVDVLVSRDDGETWSTVSTIPGQWNRTNAFVVSPKDTNVWLAAVQSDVTDDAVVRTTDAGVNWDNDDPALTYEIGEYGIPLEMHPDRPDTVYFGGELDITGSPKAPLLASYDFGQNWTQVSPGMFRSPCDIVAVPDTNIVLVGDGITGLGNAKAFKSQNGGAAFTDSTIFTGSGSEIPGMAVSRLAPNVAFATNWASGGVRRSTNYGGTWTVMTIETQAWGLAIAKDDPNVVVFGKYSAGTGFISIDGGTTFSSIPNPGGFGGEYAYIMRDRANIIALQGGGLWKLQTAYSYTPGSFAQSLSLLAPNSGEVWSPGSQQVISWSSTNIGLARLEYRRSPSDPWVLIANVPGYLNGYSWTIPYLGSNQMQVRVSDAWDAAPTDFSSGTFTITGPYLQLTAPNGGETWAYGTNHNITWASASLTNVDLEFRDHPANPWTPIATGLAAGAASYSWAIPFNLTSEAEVRIKATAGPAIDACDGVFSLTAALFAATPDTVHFPVIQTGTTVGDVIHVQNTGTAPLTVSSVVLSDPEFFVGRSSFVVPPGSSDTTGIYYHPTDDSYDTTTVTFTANDPGGSHALHATGRGVPSLAVGDGDSRVAFVLDQNHPNPFARTTLIQYTLPRAAEVTLDVFDLRGQRVARLVRGAQSAGRHGVQFGLGAHGADGRRLATVPAGVYFYRLESEGLAVTRKMLVLH